MKMPLAWHKKNLENMRRFAQRQRDAAAQTIADAERVEQHCILLDAQIIRAELKGVAEFDADKFGVKRTEPQSHRQESK